MRRRVVQIYLCFSIALLKYEGIFCLAVEIHHTHLWMVLQALNGKIKGGFYSLDSRGMGQLPVSKRSRRNALQFQMK